MSLALKTLIAVVVAASAGALAASAFLFPLRGALGLDGLVFWTLAALLTSAAPVHLPRGTVVSVAASAVLAATFLGGPVAGAIVGAVGTTEWRELRGRIPWYGSLYNHASIVLPAVVAGVVFAGLAGASSFDSSPRSLAAASLAGTCYVVVNAALTASAVAVRRGASLRAVAEADFRLIGFSLVATAPLAWLVAQSYVNLGWWGAALFALPLYSTRSAYQGFVEVRKMFTQTVRSLASAVDARDPHTNKHSERVQQIAVDIGRQMRGKNRCSEKELQNLEWGGLLHDVGKIGIPDAILLKADRLTRDERIAMNQHPVKGEEILAPVEKLHVEREIIRHHHEWYNGSGYPDRLIGDRIPKLARILHVADAFEAMTASRPYRPVPLSHAQALAELRKYTGVQFDPEVVEAFMRTEWARGGEGEQAPVVAAPVPLLQQHAAMKARATVEQGRSAT